LVWVPASWSSRNSIDSTALIATASCAESKTLVYCAALSSNSSLRVEERWTIDGREECRFLEQSASSANLLVAGTLELPQDDFVHPAAVSTSAVAIIFILPPSSKGVLRACAEKLLGLVRALESTPPLQESLPEGGPTLLKARASRVIESSRITLAAPCSTRPARLPR